MGLSSISVVRHLGVFRIKVRLYTLAQILLKIRLLIDEIAVLTDMVKQTIIYVRCCADPFRLFRCIFLYCAYLMCICCIY